MASRWEIIGTLFVIITAIVPIITQFFGGGDILSIAIFGIIGAFVFFYVAWDYIKDKFGQIEKLKKKVEEIEKGVDYMKEVHNLDKRISVLEKENERKRKGQIDPRIILIIFLAVLLYLYLRSIGIFK